MVLQISPTFTSIQPEPKRRKAHKSTRPHAAKNPRNGKSKKKSMLAYQSLNVIENTGGKLDDPSNLQQRKPVTESSTISCNVNKIGEINALSE
jgi:hypothetical protein